MNIKKKLVCTLVLFALLTIGLSHQIFATKPVSKVDLQNETQNLLIEYEKFAFALGPFKALYAAQDPDNIKSYRERYCKLTHLIDWLTKNLENWNMKISESKNDSTYRLYTAAVQTILYSIYSKPHKYLEFLKFTKSPHLKCTDTPDKENQIYENIAREWELKATIMATQAHRNIQDALEINKYSEDTRILEFQLLALKGEWDENSPDFKKLEATKSKTFNQKRSLIECWNAYFNFRNGDKKKGIESLEIASAHSSPYRYSNWANAYSNSLKSINADWSEFDFIDYKRIPGLSLGELTERSDKKISEVRDKFLAPLTAIPMYPNEKELRKLTKSSSPNVLWDIGCDGSTQNLRKFSGIIKELYQTGIKLEEDIEFWHRLAFNNKDRAFFFLLRKCECVLTLISIAEKTALLLEIPKLVQLLNDKKKSQNSGIKKIDYKAKCKLWSQELKRTFESDISSILEQKPNALYAKILEFEYYALHSNPQDAIKKLEDINRQLADHHIENFTVSNSNNENNEINSASYYHAWRSYLELKSGDTESAQKYMGLAGDDTIEWKRNLNKVIRLRLISRNKQEQTGGK